MTNVLAPYSESKSIYNGYANTNFLDNTINFIIPIYENMPEIPVQNPNILEKDYIQDNTKIYADVTGSLNIRSGPGTSYEVITGVTKDVIMTRIGKGKQAGELWDRVKLPNGIIGYAFHTYLKEAKEDIKVTHINLSLDNTTISKGSTKKLQIEILPKEAPKKELYFSVENPNIISVDPTGNILALKGGKTTITVLEKESGVSNKIDVTVYAPVTDVHLNATNLSLQVGDSFLIKTIIIPEDASNKKVLYQIDNDIVSIDEKGKLTALKEGTGKIKVISQDSNIQKEIDLTIYPKTDNVLVDFDPSLKINGGKISGFDISHSTIKEVKDKITTSFEIQVYNKDYKKLEENEQITTGSKIQIKDNDIIKMEYEVIIYGDVNGDGKINSIDLLVLQRHILEIERLEGIFLTSGNINKNGKNPSSIDSLLIQRHILGLKLIIQ